VVRLQIEKNVIDKILEEESKHGTNEYGGWLVVEQGRITDVIFDVKEQNSAYVKFDCKNLLKLPKAKRNAVKGWFHKHPIEGLSGMDWNTTFRLTNFWGECYTLVLQDPIREIVAIKTAKGKELVEKVFGGIATRREHSLFVVEKADIALTSKKGGMYVCKCNME
jgi:proteasome lid subunit RPN8/RPN11